MKTEQGAITLIPLPQPLVITFPVLELELTQAGENQFLNRV